MENVYCYSYVEDAPSAAVLRKLVEMRNATVAHKLLFMDGFPQVMGGYSDLERKCPAFLSMAKGGQYTLSLTDLDNRTCASALIRQWFAIPTGRPAVLPKEVVFRVAVREVESWIIADRAAWATYIEIAVANFADAPDDLPDPKQYMLGVIRKKGRKRYHKAMLPAGTASIGPSYNDVLCEFVRRHWSPVRASERSPSLKRAILAINRV